MQAVYEGSARPDVLMRFARRHGRDYMMRSEKRGGYGSSPNGGKTPPKRKRRRAGFFYMLLTLILSLALWPVGMILLWRRKLRWKLTTKLLTTIITLFLCVTLYGFALTVQTENPTYTRVQDSVNDFLDHSAERIGEGYTVVCDAAQRAWASATDLGGALQTASMRYAADGLDRSAVLAGSVRETVSGWFHSEDAPDPTPVADETVEPEETPMDAASAQPTPSAAPQVTGRLPLSSPESTPDPESAQPIGNGTLTRQREFTEATSTPTPTDAPAETADAVQSTPNPDETGTPDETPVPATDAPETTEPTVQPSVDPDLQPKPAGEAVVYYNTNGVNYHMHSSCKNMGTAKAGTLADAVEKGLRRCRNCETPDDSILRAENVVWVDEEQHFHLSDDCTDFAGDWSLMTLDDALAEGCTPCAACKAGLYMAASGRALPTPSPSPSPEPTATPEPTPTPSPSPTPEPVVVAPSRALKPAGEAMVYHSSNGKWYHTDPHCSGMGGAKLYSLAECVEGSYKRCRKCNAPLPELVEAHCLWMDEDGLCHTSDECPSFTGDWTLVERDQALADGRSGCVVCGADEYLVKNSIVNYPEPTPEPTDEPASATK